MQEAIYGPILDCLADHQPKTLGQIESAVPGQAKLGHVLQAVIVLTGAGSLLAVQAEAATAQAKPHCDQLNVHLIDKARGSNDINYLASPVTGGGLTVNRFEQLFLQAKAQGKQQPEEWAQHVWQIVASQGQKLVKEGQTLDTAEENLAELSAQAQTFAHKRLPIAQALGVV